MKNEKYARKCASAKRFISFLMLMLFITFTIYATEVAINGFVILIALLEGGLGYMLYVLNQEEEESE